MNRIWFAAIFLAITIGVCSYEQITIRNTFEDLTEILDVMSQDAEKEDYRAVEAKSRDMEKIWDKKYPVLSALNDHSTLNDTGVTLHSIRDLAKDENEDVKATVDEAKNQLQVIYDANKISFGNVF